MRGEQRSKKNNVQNVLWKLRLNLENATLSQFLSINIVAYIISVLERKVEFSPQAIVTRGFQSSNINNNIENTLNLLRRMKGGVNPLTQEELLEVFFKGPEPIFRVSNEKSS